MQSAVVCLFWPVCFGRKRLCTPVREDVVSSPFVSLSVTARISTIPNRNASRVILVLKSFSLKIYYNTVIVIYPLRFFNFPQRVARPTLSQKNSMRAILGVRVNSHLQSKEWKRYCKGSIGILPSKCFFCGLHVFCLFVCLGWKVVDYDAQNPSSIPADFGQRFLGRHDEPSPQLYHLILDILSPGR